jgi:hypothetical protein
MKPILSTEEPTSESGALEPAIISIEVSGDNCIIGKCVTHVDRRSRVTFRLDVAGTANGFERVVVIVPGNSAILCERGEGRPEFELRKDQREREFTICPDAPHGKAPYSVRAIYRGRQVEGTCEEPAADDDDLSVQSLSGPMMIVN